MKVIGKKVKKKEMGYIIITPAKCMKVNGKMINLMGRENTLISMVINIPFPSLLSSFHSPSYMSPWI